MTPRVCLIALLLSSALATFAPEGKTAATPWTAKQAESALRQAWRIEAVSHRDTYYQLEVRRVLSVRPMGTRFKLGYRKFEVVVTVDPIEGFFLPEASQYPYVSFCLVPQGKTWSFYGFEAIAGIKSNGRATFGCALTPHGKASVGRPVAR